MVPLSQSAEARWGLNGLVLLALSLGLYFGRLIFIPMVIALLLACMLWPGVAWLNRHGLPLLGLGRRSRRLRPVVWRARVPWAVACAAAVAILVVLVLGVTSAFVMAVPRLVQSLPNDPRKAQEVYSRFRDRFERISPWPLDPTYFPERAEESELVKYTVNVLNPNNPQFVVDTLLRLGATGGNWLMMSIIILFSLLFLLLEGRMLTQRLAELFGTAPEAQARALAALNDIAVAIRAFLVWRTIINFAMALILGLIYHILGLSQAWTWALLTGLLLYVPYLGPIVAGVPPILDALVTIDSPMVALGLLVFYVAFVTVEGYFIVPVVMGRGMDLNASTVMLACLYWDLVWGVAGLFLAMPMMAAAKTICYHVPGWRAWANLMDTRAGPLHDDASAATQVLPPDEGAVARTERTPAPPAEPRHR